MTAPAPSSSPDSAENDLCERAAALVNPASGLANDYLNVFNEIVMMIDLLPEMPDLVSNVETWSPISYRTYFLRSTLPGREGALKAYDNLDPSFRNTFDRCVSDLSRAASGACSIVLDLIQRAGDGASDELAHVCSIEAHRLRARLDKVADIVNGNETPEEEAASAAA